MKKIEIDQDVLTDYIAKHCPHYFYNYAKGECCYRKVDKQTCDLHAFADELHCPTDCPRLKTEEYKCIKGKCIHVKATIKQLKG